MSETTAEPEFAPIPLLQRRQIEAEIVGPLIEAFIERFGREACLDTAREVIAQLSRNSGAAMAERVGSTTLDAFAQALDLWRAGGALEIEVLEQSDQHLDFNVTRCRYAELYRKLGLAELGVTLSCSRDATFVEGFSPDLELIRTQTLMEGASHCDFRFRPRDPNSSGLIKNELLPSSDIC